MPKAPYPLVIISIFMVFCGTVALAGPIVVDGSPGDWMPRPPAGDNLGIVARDALERGEYIWTDAPGDERTDFSVPDLVVDLREFRVTSSLNGLYFLACLGDVPQVVGNGVVQVQIAIDLDRVPMSGETWLGGFCDTQVSADASWEYLVVTRFGSGNPAPLVFDPTWTDVGGAEAVLSDVDDCLEIFVPWASLGGPPNAAVRFTVGVFRADDGDSTWDIPGMSDALDAVTNYGDPGAALNTWDEAGDGMIDSFFDVWFHLDPDMEPSPPLEITEVLYDAVAAEPAHEWIEVHNLTGEALSLTDFRIGDEETPDEGEGMLGFGPGEVMAPSETIVIANNATEFNSVWSQTPDYELVDSDAGVPDLVWATVWAAGNVSLANSGDELLLVDPCWTIIDVVTWEGALYPGITAAPGAIAGRSIARKDATDTDDCSNDFEVLTLPTPGEFVAVSAVLPTLADRAARLYQNRPNPFNPKTSIAFTLPEATNVTLAVYGIDGRLIRTLLRADYDAGDHVVLWDGRDRDGRMAASGTYICRLEASGRVESKRMTLLK